MQASDVERIVTSYGAVLVEPTALGVVRDLRSLPFPKSDIKKALLIALNVTSDPRVREHLRTAYISVGDFQQLSDNEVRALQLWNNAASEVDADLTDIAETMSVQADLVAEVQRRVADEAGILLQELKNAGF